MNLPNPPDTYDQIDQAQARLTLEQEDAKNIKVDTVFSKFFMRDTVTGARVTVTIASGAFVIV